MKKIFSIVIISVISLSFAACEGNSGTDEPDSNTTKDVKTVTQMHKSQKRGVSFSFGMLEDAALMSPMISWQYNWGPSMGVAAVAEWFDEDSVMFCPMAWNNNFNADKIREWVKAHPQTKYLLGFNEPNLTDQCNMVPKEAAKYWPSVVALAKELNLKLVSPAMNYGTLTGYSDPIKWLDEFFACDGCSLDDIDAIAIHCYMGSPSAVKGYVERFTKYGKPIWMTEFCGWESSISSVETQKRYMCDVVNYFEQSDDIERYAWFIPRAGMQTDAYPYMQLLTKTGEIKLTELGEIYGALSTFDKSAWFDATRKIEPNNYIAIGSTATNIRHTTDSQGKWMIASFPANNYIDYQIGAKQNLTTLNVRYASYVDTQVILFIDGKEIKQVKFEKTGSGSAWNTLQVELPIDAGYHTIRFDMLAGSMDMGQFWFE